MGSMLQQIVAPLNDLGYACDPFIPVSYQLHDLPDMHCLVLCTACASLTFAGLAACPDGMLLLIPS